jgi:hypothetical protein
MRSFLINLFIWTVAISGFSQDYKSQINLIRPRPENCVVYGPVSLNEKTVLTDANISLIDPSSLEVIEKIPLDRNGWYLFSTIKKGHKYALLIEKEGFFPYYNEFTIPDDPAISHQEKPILLPTDLKNTYSLVYQPYDTTLLPLSRDLRGKLGEMLRKNPDLKAVIEPMGDSLDPMRVNLLTSKWVSQGVKLAQIKSGSQSDTLTALIKIEIRTGSDESGVVLLGSQPLTEDRWTIQFSASRSPLNKKSYKGLDPVFEFKGKDGFYRYTYGNFATKEEATDQVKMVKKKGFSQAFAKTAGSIKKL